MTLAPQPSLLNRARAAYTVDRELARRSVFERARLADEFGRNEASEVLKATLGIDVLPSAWTFDGLASEDWEDEGTMEWRAFVTKAEGAIFRFLACPASFVHAPPQYHEHRLMAVVAGKQHQIYSLADLGRHLGAL